MYQAKAKLKKYIIWKLRHPRVQRKYSGSGIIGKIIYTKKLITDKYLIININLYHIYLGTFVHFLVYTFFFIRKLVTVVYFTYIVH